LKGWLGLRNIGEGEVTFHQGRLTFLLTQGRINKLLLLL